MISFRRSECIDCGGCIRSCAPGCFAADSEGATELRLPEGCNSCGHCVSVCPTGAVVLPDISVSDFIDYSRPDINSQELITLMKGRRSIRNYGRGQVSDQDIRELLDVACHAGTASNAMSERFIVIQNRATIEALELLVVETLWNTGLKFLGFPLVRAVLSGVLNKETVAQYRAYYDRVKKGRRKDDGRGLIFRNAPTLFIVQGLKRNPLGQSNAGIAIRNVELLAEAKGLGSCWVGFLTVAARSPRIRRFLNLPSDRTVLGALMLGYPDEKYPRIVARNDRTDQWIR